MTEPIVPEESTGAAYTSDRNLLLQEVQLLGKEVARLRGDTKHLNEVIVPKEEHARRRRVYGTLAGISFVLFAVAMIGLYALGQRLKDTQDGFNKTVYNSCLVRNKQADQSTETGVAIAGLLNGLEKAERQNTTPGIDAVRDARIKAYNDFATFLASQPAPPPPVDCKTFLQ